MSQPVNIDRCFTKCHDMYSPKIVGELIGWTHKWGAAVRIECVRRLDTRVAALAGVRVGETSWDTHY